MTRRYSHSYLNAHAKCPLQGHMMFDLHLAQRGMGRSHHLAYGAACHEAWRVLSTTRDVELAKSTLRQHYPKQLDLEDKGKTADNGCFAIDCYVKEYNWDKNWKILAIEHMDADEDDYVVKLDKVVEDKVTGDIIGIDHKFTGRYLNADFFNDFNPNSQVTQYYKYIKEKYGRCDQFIIDAVSLRHRQRAYKGEPAGPWVAFERLILNRTDQQIAQDVISRNDTIADIEHCREIGRWRMNTNSCRFCAYRPICAAGWDWENDSELILSNYRQVCDKWVPPMPANEQDDVVAGFHCQLDLGHEGAHHPEAPEEATAEFVVEV